MKADMNLTSAPLSQCGTGAASRSVQPETTDHARFHRLRTLDIEQAIARARPRLVRLAHAHGLPDDAAQEAVQETLLEAWRHLDRLADPVGFQAWLNAICRNVCHRYGRAHAARAQREVSLEGRDDAAGRDTEEAQDFFDLQEVADPLAIDPVAELERHDREIILDRALGFLSAPAREAVTLCYLAELPQREVARHLGLTIAALEARLHRARRQLRQVLHGELRPQSEAFGLVFETDDELTIAAGWRDTRLWCPYCARHRLRGAFEPLPTRRTNLHLRCPGCAYEVNSWGHVPLEGMRSFRPAYKRVMHFICSYFQPGLRSGQLPCEVCGSPAPLRLARAVDLPDHRNAPRDSHQSDLVVAIRCPVCHRHDAEVDVATLMWTQPDVQRFLAAHPRTITEPEALVMYRGQPAVRVRLTAICTAARLTLLTHPQTLQVLATFHG